MKGKTRITSFILLILLVLNSLIVTPYFLGLALSNETDITVFTDSTVYAPDNYVTIQGYVLNSFGDPLEQCNVALEVKDPRENTVFLDLVHSSVDGSYIAGFRLPDVTPIGVYKVYASVWKSGYQPSYAQSGFTVSTTGENIIYIVDRKSDLVITVATVGFNITQKSVLGSLVVSCRLEVLNPNLVEIYDNFDGVGTVVDLKKVGVLPNELSEVIFNFVLQDPVVGSYAYRFRVFSDDGQVPLADTGWQPSFSYYSDTIYQFDFGILNPQTTSVDEPSLSLLRGDVISYNFTLNTHVENVTLRVVAAPNDARLSAELLRGDGLYESRHSNYWIDQEENDWEIFNIPDGEYIVYITCTSENAEFTSFTVEVGREIVSFSIDFSGIPYSDAETATPGGLINFYVPLEWKIYSPDIIEVEATINGEVVGTVSYPISPLSMNKRVFILEMKAPESVGTYGLEISACISSGSISVSIPVDLQVVFGDFNIVLQPQITYLKSPPLWHLARVTDVKVVNPEEISVLRVENVTFVRVLKYNVDGTPVSGIVRFNVTNMVSDEIVAGMKFGDAPPYVVKIHDHVSGDKFEVTALSPGEETVVEIVVDIMPFDVESGSVDFEIIYEIWWIGVWTIALSGAFFSTLKVFIPVGSAVWGYTDDIAKLAIQMVFKYCLYEQNSMTMEDAYNFFQKHNIWSGSISILNHIAKKTNNPVAAMMSVFLYLQEKKKINLGQVIDLSISLALLTFQKNFINNPDNWQQILYTAVDRTLIIFGEKAVSATVSTTAIKSFTQTLAAIVSVFSFITFAYRVLTSPGTEIKWVGAELGTGPALEGFDPVIAITFTGPSNETGLTSFRDVKEIVINFTRTGTNDAASSVAFVVDENITSSFLPLFSDPSFQEHILSGFGFNATNSTLNWGDGSGIFELVSNGTLLVGVDRTYMFMNSSYVYGDQILHDEGIRLGKYYWLNHTLSYPFGYNLTYSISVDLPENTAEIIVVSSETYTISGKTIIWNTPVEEISIGFTLTCNHTVELLEGWNLIGVPFELQDPLIESIFDVNLTYVDAIYGYAEGVWTYWFPVSSTLDEFECGKGYWVLANDDFTTTLTGTPGDASFLVEDWNLVGVNSTEPVPTEDYLAGTNWSVVYGYDAQTETWSYYINSVGGPLDTLKPGEGYWILIE